MPIRGGYLSATQCCQPVSRYDEARRLLEQVAGFIVLFLGMWSYLNSSSRNRAAFSVKLPIAQSVPGSSFFRFRGLRGGLICIFYLLSSSRRDVWTAPGLHAPGLPSCAGRVFDSRATTTMANRGATR